MSYEIVEDVERCRQVVNELLTHHVISADAEGINLGRDGPLTLLQVGTRDGHVYLFDVMKEREMFGGGGLTELLESYDVLKVFHGASVDSLALECQFGVTLSNVFDTQIAHVVLQESSGVTLPRHARLAELSELYGTRKLEEKAAVKTKWSKEKANYWETRPFTTEMINYACTDVQVLLPELYENLLRRLKKENVVELFKDRVEENLRYMNDKDVRELRRERYTNNAKTILVQMGRRGANDTATEDEKKVMNMTWTVDEVRDCMTNCVRRLFYEKRAALLKEIQQDMDQEGDDFCPTLWHFNFLKTSMTYVKPSIKRLASSLFESLQKIALDDIALKYNGSTPFTHVGKLDELFLSDIEINSPSDLPNYERTTLALYFKMKQKQFKDFEQKLIENPSGTKVSKHYLKTLRKQMKQTYLPKFVRDAATDLYNAMVKAGKIPDRPAKTKSSRYTWVRNES